MDPKSFSGFTLVEIFIVIGLMAILVSLSAPLYTSLQTAQPLRSSRDELVFNLRLAQEQSRSGQSASNFGIFLTADGYTMYRGASYATRLAPEDRLFYFLDGIQSSGITEVNFATTTGLPAAEGSIVLRHVITGLTEIITVDRGGLIY